MQLKRTIMFGVAYGTQLACRREYVVRVLMKVVDGLTVDDAVNVMQVCSHLLT